jgi:DNA polymerase
MGREERPDGRVVSARTSIYGAKLFQNWVQAVSCDAIAYAAWLMRKHYGHTLAGNTHDELTYIAPVRHAPGVLDQLLWCMRQRPAWMPNLPLNAEGKWGLSYADV